jgi:hypothetical protein
MGRVSGLGFFALCQFSIAEKEFSLSKGYWAHYVNTDRQYQLLAAGRLGI